MKLTPYSVKALSTIKSGFDKETCINIAAKGIRMLMEGNVYLNYQMMLDSNTLYRTLTPNSLMELELESYRIELGCDSLALLLMMIKTYVCRLVVVKWNPMDWAIAHEFKENKCYKISKVSDKFFAMMLDEICNNNLSKWNQRMKRNQYV